MQSSVISTATRPFIVAFDGIDGVGKSTLINRLDHWLRGSRSTVNCLAFPNGEVRERILSGEVDDRVETAKLVRDQIVEQVSAVKEGILLIDRYSASGYVYQYCNETDEDRRAELLAIIGSYPKPNVHVFLRANNVGEAFQRVPKAKRNRFDADSLELAQSRQSAYLEYYATIRASYSEDVISISDTFAMKASSQTIWEEITKFRWDR